MTHSKQLLIRGIGYRTWKSKGYINFDLGYTHYIALRPSTVQVIVKKTKLMLYSPSKAETSQLNVLVQRLKAPDAYKGKGIREVNQELKLKVGKVR